MRINARAFLPSTLLLSLVAGPFIPAASADLAAVAYTATIESGGTVTIVSGTTSNTYAVGGDTIKGTFTYAAPTTNPSGTISPATYILSGLSPAPTLTFAISAIPSGNPMQPLGPPAFSDHYVSGTYGASVALSSTTTLSLTGPMNNAAVNFALILNSTTATGLALPGTTTIVNNFSPTNSKLMLSDVQTVGNSESFTADITQVAAIVPEPSSLLIAILTLVTGAVRFLIRPKPWLLRQVKSPPLPHP